LKFQQILCTVSLNYDNGKSSQQIDFSVITPAMIIRGASFLSDNECHPTALRIT
tara:strand:+ start:40306 stop:40467 length:162 start_codon:yes stop_codon:yes gene_type:complete